MDIPFQTSTDDKLRRINLTVSFEIIRMIQQLKSKVAPANTRINATKELRGPWNQNQANKIHESELNRSKINFDMCIALHKLAYVI